MFCTLGEKPETEENHVYFFSGLCYYNHSCLKEVQPPIWG